MAFVALDITTDNIGENVETFHAVLISPSANAVLGDDDATVMIADSTNERVQFNSTTYSENENAGMVTFTVVKIDESERPVSVVFGTTADRAQGISLISYSVYFSDSMLH